MSHVPYLVWYRYVCRVSPVCSVVRVPYVCVVVETHVNHPQRSVSAHGVSLSGQKCVQYCPSLDGIDWYRTNNSSDTVPPGYSFIYILFLNAKKRLSQFWSK